MKIIIGGYPYLTTERIPPLTTNLEHALGIKLMKPVAPNRTLDSDNAPVANSNYFVIN